VVWSGEAIGAFPPESQGLGDMGDGVGTHVGAVSHCAVALTMQLCGLRGKQIHLLSWQSADMLRLRATIQCSIKDAHAD
jgi:hypothetical protein